jgi:hypothetical protein
MRGELSTNRQKDHRGHKVISVKPADDLSSGHLDAFVESVGLPIILLGNPYQVRILFKDLYGIVLRAPIDDDVLKIGILLCGNTLDTPSNISGTVIRRGNYRYFDKRRPYKQLAYTSR